MPELWLTFLDMIHLQNGKIVIESVGCAAGRASSL